jgi:hypothetical protein
LLAISAIRAVFALRCRVILLHMRATRVAIGRRIWHRVGRG